MPSEAGKKMPKTSYADVHLDVDPHTPIAQRERPRERMDEEIPFRILILGDFSGRENRGITSKGPRKPIAVDRDNFEDVLESLNVALQFSLGENKALDISFHEYDDFHPDRLYSRLPVFGKLKDLRERVSDPGAFAEVAKELGISLSEPREAPAPPEPGPAPAAASFSSGSFLEQAIQATESRGAGAAPARSMDPMARYLRALVAPHLVPKAHSKQADVTKQVDGATGGVMRAILHHPHFQALEAAWRSLDFLVRGLETGPKLKVFILDMSNQEVAADLAAAGDLRQTALYKILVEQTVRTPGAHPWALVVGLFDFGPQIADVNLLGRFGLLASQAKAPFLAGGSTRLFGCKSLADTPYPEDWKSAEDLEGWDLIRGLPEARYLGLVLPRFLLRLPYGKETESIEGFDFEEMPGKPVHGDYLWGNPAMLCAYLLGRTFSEFGWNMQGDEILSVRGLPIHIYKQDGEAKITPCAETFLTQTAMERIHERGLMVLLSYTNSDQVRLAGFRSVADPVAALLSRWG
jgi:type VI secretion system protein ImpC